jgi:diacylglycerol kinase (ATP)
MVGRILFIVNLFSGANAKTKKIALMNALNGNNLNTIIQTEYPYHATEIAKEGVENNIDRIIAVGGDGTVNEVAKSLINTETALGIIPFGSGNGLARHLKIPMEFSKAIIHASEAIIQSIDSCLLNDIPFVCTAGVGFDAYVASIFSKKKTRGLLTYIQCTFEAYWNFKPTLYHYDVNGLSYSEKLFAITFANASQYGNDAVVAPESKINDGLIDMVYLRPFPLIYAPILGFRLFSNSFSKSRYVTTIKTTNIFLQSDENLLIHFDGEPRQLSTNSLNVSILPNSLKVITNYV